MVGKRSAFQSKSGGHLVGIQSILAKYLFGCTEFGPKKFWVQRDLEFKEILIKKIWLKTELSF